MPSAFVKVHELICGACYEEFSAGFFQERMYSTTIRLERPVIVAHERTGYQIGGFLFGHLFLQNEFTERPETHSSRSEPYLNPPQRSERVSVGRVEGHPILKDTIGALKLKRPFGKSAPRPLRKFFRIAGAADLEGQPGAGRPIRFGRKTSPRRASIPFEDR